ncbi:MAG TPA: TolC family protein [Elusimicrobiota bacterium]|jgi:outer membrane protein TolC|nr:TolC family protein [Elusimicrobiota bacterium]
MSKRAALLVLAVLLSPAASWGAEAASGADGQGPWVWSEAGYVAAVLAVSPEASQARSALVSADAQWKSDLADSVLPQLSATANAYPYGQNPLNGYQFNSWRINRRDAALNSGLSWNLFNSFADYLKVRSSHLSREIARKEVENVLQGEALKAVRAYYDLLLQSKLVEVSQETLKAQQAQYQLTLELYRHGAKSLADTLKMETDLRSSELALEGAQADRRQALFHFNTLAGRDAEQEADLIERIAVEAADRVPLDSGMRQALRDRPEMVKTRLEEERSHASKLQAWQGSLPSLTFGFQWNYQESATFGLPASSFGIANPNHQFSLALSLPVGLNGVSQYQRVRGAKAQEQGAHSATRALTRSVKEEVFSAYNQLIRSRRTYEIAMRKRQISGQSLNLVLQQYRQGGADVIRLSQAQLDYVNAQVERMRAFHDAKIGLADYRRAVGEALWR